jgi:hypothetical protein
VGCECVGTCWLGAGARNQRSAACRRRIATVDGVRRQKIHILVLVWVPRYPSSAAADSLPAALRAPCACCSLRYAPPRLTLAARAVEAASLVVGVAALVVHSDLPTVVKSGRRKVNSGGRVVSWWIGLLRSG